MVECERVGELLSAELDGELAADGATAIEAHLSGCAACREERERLAQVRSLVRSLPARRAPDPVWGDLRDAAVAHRLGGRARAGLTAAVLAMAVAAGGALGAAAGDDRGAPVAVDVLVTEHLAVSGPAPAEVGRDR